MIKEKLLEYKFFQFLLKIKLGLKRTFQRSRFLEKKYDRNSFIEFQRLVEDSDYLYEKEIEFLPSIIHKGNIVLDIGANRGEYSFYLSGIVGKNGTVAAFEPGNRAFALLEKIKNHYKLENLKLFNFAITNRKGDETLIVPYFNRQSQLKSERPIKGRKEIVTTTTLDDLLSDLKFSHVDFIKCDTEGSEYFVFSGGIKSIEKFKPIIQVEIADLHSTRFGYTSLDVLNLLRSINYLTYYYHFEKKKLIKTDTIEMKTDSHVWSRKSENLSNNNYFFIHSSRLDDFKNLISE